MKEKIALITGCSSGIGREIAIELNKRGVKVIATARTPEKISDLKRKGILTEKLDVTNYPEMELLIKNLKEKNLFPDILINNAGYGIMGAALEVPIEKIELEFRTNVFGALKLAQIVGREMVKNKKGLIVNIGSVAGLLTTPFASVYSASKAAINAFTDGLRIELKPFNVKVLLVQPGAIVSKFGENALKETTEAFPENSFYADYRDRVIRRATLSQEKATPTTIFVKKLSNKILSKNPPPVFRFGEKSFLSFFLSKFIPAGIRDYLLGKAFGIK